MHADVAFVEMSHHSLWQGAWMFGRIDKLWIDGLFAHQDGDARALRLIILTRNVQNIGSDDGAGF